MVFAGIPRAATRADLIAYLNSRADNPAPLPKAAEAPATRRPPRHRLRLQRRLQLKRRRLRLRPRRLRLHRHQRLPPSAKPQ